MEKKFQLSYGIAKIQTTRFSFEEMDEESIQLLFNKAEGLGYNVNLHIGFDDKKSTVSFLIETQLFRVEDNHLIVEHIGKTDFFVDGYQSLKSEASDELNVPDDLLLQWISISYTHARALLSVELSPTCYRDLYFLPVVDPKVFLKKTLT